MKTCEDEPCPGLNKRLRPRISAWAPDPQNKSKTKTDGKVQEHLKKASKFTKLSLSKRNDLTTKSDFSSTLQFLCPYCDRKFISRQSISKHVQRIHLHISKLKVSLTCLFCNHLDTHAGIVRHMVDNHQNQYFACLDCHIRFYSTFELAEHKLSVCKNQKPNRKKLQQKVLGNKSKKSLNVARKCDVKDGNSFNSIVISCELKPAQDQDQADIEDKITTNLILPSSRILECNSVIEKNAVIVLDDIHWNKSISPKFKFYSADPDQILSRLGVVHRSPRTGECTKKDWFKLMDESAQKFEKCFDTQFYCKVASNVQENMSYFLDGSCNFNPETVNIIRTRKTKNSLLNTVDDFPILLASEQYSRSALDGYQPRPIAPKHKWKWEILESNRSVFDPSQMESDAHTNNCIITLVSRLDIWTQLCMRRKFEEMFTLNVSVEKGTENQNIISKQLKEILESREIPTSSHIVRYTGATAATSSSSAAGLPMALGLMPTPPAVIPRPAVLSGEWVRPRCYMCSVCGEQRFCPKGLSTHISTNHPYAHVQYYEIVGEKLLNSDILKYLYVPPSQISSRIRLTRGFKTCTKCNKSVTLEELHKHILECAGDTPAVRRRYCRHRPFGVRRRRTRIPEHMIQNKIRKDIRMQPKQKNCVRSRPRIRTEVGDAETIRKMLMGLPAKRQRVLVNPVSMVPKSRREFDESRNKFRMQLSSLEDKKKKCSKLPCKKSTSSDVKLQLKYTDDLSLLTCKSDYDMPFNSKAENNSLQPYESRSLKVRRNTIVENKRKQHEILRQKVVKASKRKSVRVREIKPTEHYDTIDKTRDASTSRKIEDFITTPPLRLDVENLSFKKRVNASCDTSEKRYIQSSVLSDVSGGKDQPDPVQKVPLTHSIARLTANSETHDKSVQFHHLFLVQQECNNADQPASSGLSHLFENETVVTRLDKPPLINKVNRPKKGLNDCIAMLKNKLSKPKPSNITDYTSVHIGREEPIGTVSSTIKTTPVGNLAQVVVLSECPSDKVVQDSASKVNKESGKSHVNKICSSLTKESDEKVTCGLINNFPKPKKTVLCTVVTFPSNNIQTSLNDEQDAVKQAEANVQTTTHPQFGIKALENKKNIEVMLSKPTPTFLAPKPLENQYILSKTFSKTEPFSYSPIELNEIGTLYLKPPEKHLKNGAATVSQSKFSFGVEDVGNPTTNLDHLETSLSIKGVVPPKTIGLQCDTPRWTISNLNENLSPCARPILEVNRNNFDVTIDHYKQQLNERFDAETSITSASNISRSFSSYQPKTAKHINLNTEKQKSNQACVDNISLAHDCINGDSLIAAPLDLSSNITTHKSFSNLGFCGNIYRENLGTLDLSKKKTGSRIFDIFTTKDEVIDLRIKRDQRNTSYNDYDSMSQNFLYESNYPTDLSLKGKDTYSVPFPSSCTNDASKNISQSKMTCVDAGGSISATCNSEMPEIVKARSRASLSISATDLSDLAHSPVIGTLDETTSNLTSKKTCVELNVSTNLNQGSRLEQLRGLEKQAFKPSENSYSSLILKPVNDPNLKIPKYKIRNMDPNTEISCTSDLAKAKITSSTTITAEIFSKTFSRGSSSGGRVLQTIPYLCKTSHSVTDGAVPVYTLANTCIPVTKLETKKKLMLTNTLLSIPESTVTKTAAVYTSTGAYNDFFNDSASIHNLNRKTILSSDPASQPISRTPTISKQNTSNKMDTNGTGQGPDTRQIDMPPKELVEIIRNLPVDQIKQLLNILPQYVSTSNKATIIETTPVLGNADLNFEEQLREPNNKSSLIEQKTFLNYQELSRIGKIQERKQDMNETHAKILQGFEDITIDIRTLGMSTLNPSLNLISRPLFTSFIRIQNNVCKNVIAPPITTLESSFLIPMPSSGISDHALTTINTSLQMCDSKKIASLRAVRINATTVRHNDNEQLRKKPISQDTIQKSSEPARSINRESIKLINASAIQQIEISNTPQGKLSDIESKSVSVIPVKRSELNKLNLDAMSTANHLHLGIEQNKSPNHLKSRPFMESMKIITGTVGVKLDTTSSNDQSYVGMVACADVFPSVTKEYEKDLFKPLSSETDINVVVANIFKKEHKDECYDTQLLKSNFTVDYDSEDDLILSTLQKMNFNERAIEKACRQDIMTTRKRNTIGKIVKKRRQDEGTNMVNQYRKPVVRVDSAAIIQDGSDRRELRHQGINTDKKRSSSNELNEVIDICLNKRNPKQPISNYFKEGKHCKRVSPKDEGQTFHVSGVAITEKQEMKNFLRVQNQAETKYPKQNTVKKNSKNKKKQKRRAKIKSKLYTSLRESTIKNSCNKQVSKVMKETEDREMMQISSENKKSYGMHKKTAEIIKNELVPELQPASNYSVMAPLRRSLRGKSLYVESNNTVFERNNLDTDMIREHKAPLPKKQLIFYKLLHDEQIHTKSLHINPEKELLKDDTLNIPFKVQPFGSTTLAINGLENSSRKLDRGKKLTKHKINYQKKKCASYKKLSEVSLRTDNLKVGDQSHVYINCTTGFHTHQIRSQKIVAQEENISTHEESTKICRTNDISAGLFKNNEETLIQTSVPAEKRKICKSCTGRDLVPVPKRAKLSQNNGSKMPKICQHTLKSNCISVMEKPSALKSKTAKHCTGKVSKMPVISQNSTDTKIISNPQAVSVMNIKTVIVSLPNKGELSKIIESASAQVSQYTTETKEICVTIDSNLKSSSCNSAKKAVYTCYDVPAAAKKAHLKSVVTTSTTDIYDPYDIDLDDMIRIEPLRKLPMERAEIKGKYKVNTRGFNTQNHTTLKNKNCKKEYDTKSMTSKCNTGLQTREAEEGSDSINSSKSDDVPLVKYVKQTKSIDTLKGNIYVENDHKEKVSNNSQRRYKKTRHSSVNYGIDDVVALKSKENIRSEHFMESFGFFSERKPRKSNLVAAQKISDTFHVIYNESDDSYLDFTDLVSKRTSQSESNKKSSVKRMQKLCKPAVFIKRNCHVCKSVFFRPDNFVRHLLSSVHLIKLAKVEHNVILLIATQRPNCLVYFRESLKSTYFLHHELEKNQSAIESTQTVLPKFSEIIIEVFKKAKILHFSQHCGRNSDEALFLNYCEMHRESHKPNKANQKVRLISNMTSCHLALPLGEEDDEAGAEANKEYLRFLEREIDKSNPGFVFTTAIGGNVESDEVRNLEKDLITNDATGLDADRQLEVARADNEILSIVNNLNYSEIDTDVQITLNNVPTTKGTNKYKKNKEVENTTQRDNEDLYRTIKYSQFKEKLYPDIKEIDMFEDKFDKIKRKCRSQAAAAKQNMQVVRKSINEG